MKEQLTIHFKNKIITLEIKDFGNLPIDTEDLLQVQWNDVLGDIITFPVILNRIGMIKAQMDDFVRETEMDFEIFEATKRNEYRKKLIKREPKARGDGDKVSFPTETEVKDGMITDPQYKIKRDNLNKVKKESDIFGALFAAAKSKDKKLDAVSMKLRPEEFETEILEAEINSVMIRAHKNHFPNRRT